MGDDIIKKYLISRGLFEPAEIAETIINGKKEVTIGNSILNNDELLARAAGIYQDNEVVLKAVIVSRLEKMVNDLLFTAVPEETMATRQAMIEVAAIFEDFKKYSEEYKRRAEIKNRPKEQR